MRLVEEREDKRLRWQWQISFNRKETDMKSDITFTRNYLTHKTLNKKVKGEGLKTLFYIYARQGKNERVP